MYFVGSNAHCFEIKLKIDQFFISVKQKHNSLHFVNFIGFSSSVDM